MDRRQVVWGEFLAAHDEIVSGVEATGSLSLYDDLFSDRQRDSELPGEVLSGDMIDVDEPAVVVASIKVWSADTQLGGERRIAKGSGTTTRCAVPPASPGAGRAPS